MLSKLVSIGLDTIVCNGITTLGSLLELTCVTVTPIPYTGSGAGSQHTAGIVLYITRHH